MAVLLVLLSLLVGVASYVAYKYYKNITYWRDRGIPHEPPDYFFGNLKGFRKDRCINDIIKKLYFKFKGTGPYCGMYFFQRPNVMVLDTKLAKQILIKDFNNFVNRGLFANERNDPLTGHLFALDGNKWRQLRHRLSPTFTSGKMKFMFPTIVSVAEQFVELLQQLVEKQQVLEIKDLLARFTTDVIGSCAFGIECNSLKNPDAEFRIMGRKAFREVRHSDIVMGFIQSFPDIARKLGMRIVTEEVHQFFMRIVRETVRYREEHQVKRNDFMDLLLELKNKKSFKTEDGETLSALTVEEIAAQGFVFFLAGFETSSTTMGFALYELARHQDVQNKLRNEINEVATKHNGQFTYEYVKDLHYLNQVVSETLRMYTVVPNLIREAAEDYIVPGYPKYTIEKGTQVLIPAVGIHSDPDIYPDPDTFNPDRFSPEAVKLRDSVEWLPFGEGPRNCIGMRFGQMQSWIGLALLIKHFRFSFCEQTQDPLHYDPLQFILSVDGGIHLRVERV